MAESTLYPTADSLVYQLYPDGNYGDNPALEVFTRIYDCNERTFLKFDLSSLPAGAVISLAKLRCYCYSIANLVAGVTDVQARRVSDDSWVELEITWTNQPDYGDVEDTKVPAVGWVEWDVTSFVQAEWAGDKIVSICLRCVQETYDETARGSRYRSKEYDAEDPELYIEYTVPPTYKVTVAEKLGMVDAVKPVRGLHVTAAEKLGLVDAVKSARGLRVTVAEKLGLVDDYFKRVTAGRLPDNPDNVGSRGSPIYKDMPDYMGAVYVNTKNTWQDAENLDELHGYKSYMWIPEETFKVKLMKLHVYAEKFRAYSKAAKETLPSHSHTLKLLTTTSLGGGDHSHSVTGTTSTSESAHKHPYGTVYLGTPPEPNGYLYVVLQSGFPAAEIPCHVSVEGDVFTVDYPEAHAHSVSGQTAVYVGKHTHTVDFTAKTTDDGGGTHGHDIDYGIWEEEEDMSERTLSAILYDPKGNPLKEWDPLTTGEMDIILDLTEYFKDLKYGMYRLELEASGRIRVRLVYYELGIMFAM